MSISSQLGAPLSAALDGSLFMDGFEFCKNSGLCRVGFLFRAFFRIQITRARGTVGGSAHFKRGMKGAAVTAGLLACFTAANARSVRVDHAFGLDKVFKSRGSMEVLVDPSRASAPSATLQPLRLAADAGEMEELIAGDGLYLIRVATDDSSTQHVLAAIPACQLRLASFREEITLHVEWDGLIVGLDYKSPIGPLASTRDCTKMPVPESAEIVTKTTVVRSASAQSVPIQVLANSPPPGLQNLKEQIGTKDSKAASSQSLLVRYWYIFVPCLLLYMFSAGGPEQSGPAPPAASGGR